MKNDILFRTHLQYQIDTSQQAGDSDNVITLADVESINLHKCTFNDFRHAVLYVREQNPEMFFVESILETIKPAGYIKTKLYDFIELTEYARHEVINIGNMALFSELQKVANAVELFQKEISKVAPKPTPVITFDDYNNHDIKSQPIVAEELGSCVITGGNQSAIRVTAHLHPSSTEEHPIVRVNYYSLTMGFALDNVDVIDLNNIYLDNASLIEAFVYMSYNDYMNNLYNYSFDKLLIERSIDLDSIDDMYSKHCDLRVLDKIS
jgi:hypothetical protein